MSAGASPVRCVVVDHHAVVRAGLVRLLEREGDFEVVGDLEHADGLVGLVGRRRADIAIMDLDMPNFDGAEVCRALAGEHPGTRVVVYTDCDDQRRLEQALEAGVSGYVLRTSPPAELIRALRLIHGGRTYVDGVLAAGLMRPADAGRPARLSPREREVLQLLSAGMTTDAAAATLFLSPTTVRSYAESAMQKLDTRNRTHAVAQALRLTLID